MTNIFSQMKKPVYEVEAQIGTTQWLPEDDIKEIDAVGKESKEVTMLDVYQAMKEEDQGDGYIYLDNIDLKGLGITEQQFAGYCSALTKAGVYQPVDKFFGKITH